MKNKGNWLYGLLFGLLMVFLFSFMIQEHFKPFKTKELMGYFLKPNKPKFRWEWYKNGYFQKHLERHDRRGPPQPARYRRQLCQPTRLFLFRESL